MKTDIPFRGVCFFVILVFSRKAEEVMTQTVDQTVSQTAYHAKSSGIFSWGLFMVFMGGVTALSIAVPPVAPYASRLAAVDTISTEELVIQEDMSSLDRALYTLEDMQTQRDAMKQFNAAQNIQLSARDLIELEKTMRQAGFSESYISDFVAKKKSELALRTEDDTSEFAKSIAKEIVREEIDSVAHRIDLVTRVGGFIMRKVQNSQ